jgi:hypothetical protein
VALRCAALRRTQAPLAGTWLLPAFRSDRLRQPAAAQCLAGAPGLPEAQAAPPPRQRPRPAPSPGPLRPPTPGRPPAGENTFGKGLIQTVVDLSDGSGMAITVAKYQTPGGIDINKTGISPDIKVGPEALPAPGPEAVCKLLTSDAAPRLFK